MASEIDITPLSCCSIQLNLGVLTWILYTFRNFDLKAACILNQSCWHRSVIFEVRIIIWKDQSDWSVWKDVVCNYCLDSHCCWTCPVNLTWWRVRHLVWSKRNWKEFLGSHRKYSKLIIAVQILAYNTLKVVWSLTDCRIFDLLQKKLKIVPLSVGILDQYLIILCGGWQNSHCWWRWCKAIIALYDGSAEAHVQVNWELQQYRLCSRFSSIDSNPIKKFIWLVVHVVVISSNSALARRSHNLVDAQ